MSLAKLNLVCCQFDMGWEDRKANFAKVTALLQDNAPPARSLIILPEMFSTGFSMDVGKIADTDGATADFLSQLAKSHESWVLAGLVNKNSEGQGLNQAVLCDPTGKSVGTYNKMHLFSPAGEAKYFASGNQIFMTHIQGFKVAVLICYDLRFPELFREAVKSGAEIFVIIASWPEVRSSHWCTLLEARAIENQAYVVGVNRCGKDPKNNYSGQSRIIDPWGTILADAGSTEGVVSFEIDREVLLLYRRDLPFLKDARS